MNGESICKSEIPELFVCSLRSMSDTRGGFTKFLQSSVISQCWESFVVKEIYYSCSVAGVLRGMHFQRPPAEHNKLVHCLSGRALDVVVDLRNAGFGKIFTREMSGNRPEAILVPKGCAHGFLALEDNTVMLYAQDTEYTAKLDDGVRYDSFGFNWPFIGTPVLSERDKAFSNLNDLRGLFE